MAVLIKLFTMKSAPAARTRPGRRFEWTHLEVPKRSLSGTQQSKTWWKKPNIISAFIQQTELAGVRCLTSAPLRPQVLHYRSFVLYSLINHWYAPTCHMTAYF